ncbi:MAG: hypothetical protein J7L39_02485 [Candidatus Aenigmarchaeota archaeon]|nr:hypothetical protein [Candidatus Aenigmarchaeota archaeon]
MNNLLNGNILKEDEFVPPEVKFPPPVPLERIEEIGEIPLFPPINDEFEKYKIPERIPEGNESIIIDPLAYYVPYHSHPKLWGIYFRIKKLITTLIS